MSEAMTTYAEVVEGIRAPDIGTFEGHDALREAYTDTLHHIDGTWRFHRRTVS